MPRKEVVFVRSLAIGWSVFALSAIPWALRQGVYSETKAFAYVTGCIAPVGIAVIRTNRLPVEKLATRSASLLFVALLINVSYSVAIVAVPLLIGLFPGPQTACMLPPCAMADSRLGDAMGPVVAIGMSIVLGLNGAVAE